MAVSYHERVTHTAGQLLEARRSNRLLPTLDDRYAPTSMHEAYAVQDEITRQLGLPVAGWKVGLVPGVRVIHAPIYLDACLQSPAQLYVAGLEDPMVEGEVGFVLRRDLPPRAQPYLPAEVADAVELACAAIEIGAPRLRNFMEAPIEHKIADNIGDLGPLPLFDTSDGRRSKGSRQQPRKELQ